MQTCADDAEEGAEPPRDDEEEIEQERLLEIQVGFYNTKIAN
jgi:hypothetical protein